VRVVIDPGCKNRGSHPSPDSFEQLAAYADFQAAPGTADIDWSDEFDCIADQTLGGSIAA
jgi:hypothetical protein